MNGRILVTPRSATAGGHPSLEKLEAAGYEVVFCTPGEQPTEEELIELLPDCVGYLAGVEKVTARVLEAARGLKVISRNGIGIDNVDLDAAGRLGIKVCPAVGANASGVAELTIALMFALARSIPFSDQAIKTGAWQRRKGIELKGKTLGLLGCGRIGRLVAEMGLGLGMNVAAYDVLSDASFAPGDGFRWAPLDEVIEQADVLSLHCPPSPDGTPLIDAPKLARMKPGAYLVNTARHDLVDPAGLAESLETGHVAGAALDVFDTEPPTDRRLVENDRVIATPHIGGFTHQSVDAAMQAAVDNLLEEL